MGICTESVVEQRVRWALLSKRGLLAGGAALALIVPAVPTSAYNISILGRYHERMTVLAERCAAAPAAPVKCAVPASPRAFTSVPPREGNYWKASRWSDDPTRQGTPAGFLKILRNTARDHCVDYINGFNAFPGLLCNGHYGSLQFLHAMASLEPGETVEGAAPEPFDVTVRKMKGWTALAFDVASGRLALGAPYCASVREYGATGAALAPANFPYCGSWSVRTLFGFTCANPFSSGTCRVNISDAGVRRSAAGALVHMIQDSYSRSHAGRGETLPFGPYRSAQVRCRPVDAFYRYSLEQKENHSDADKAPTFEGCAGKSVMDPITASARMIWLVRNGCDASWAVALVGEGVIANRMPAVPASVAQCQKPSAAQAQS